MSFTLSHSLWQCLLRRAQVSCFGVPNHGKHPGPPEDDRLTVKRELENQDGASAQKMYQVLDAVNRGQSQLLPSHFRPAFSVRCFSPPLTFFLLQVHTQMAPAALSSNEIQKSKEWS